MKKILSILLCGALLCGFVFAQEGGLAVKAGGSATLSWGIDFGSGTKKDSPTDPAYPYHGFYNEHDLGIYIPFFDKQEFNGGSENKDAAVYADVAFMAQPNGNRGADAFDWSVKARLTFFKVYMTVYNKPYFGTSYALGWNPITHKSWENDRDGWFNPSFKGWGTKIGYADKDLMDIDVGLKLGSNQNWLKEGADGKNYNGKESLYAIGLDFRMMPLGKYLGIDATVNSTFHAPNRYIAGITPENVGGKEDKNVVTNFGVKLGSEPIDGLSVGLGFDGVTGLQYENKDGKPDATFGWDIGFTVGYKWVDFALYVCGPATQYHGYDVSDKDPAKHWEDGANMAMHLGFVSEESGDTNFVDGLAFHATLNMYDLLAKRNNEDIDADDKKVYMAMLNVGPDASPAVAAAKAAVMTGAGYTAWAGGDPSKTFDDYLKDAAAAADPLVGVYNTAYKGAQEMIAGFSRSKKLGATIPLGLNLGVSYKRHINDSMWIKPFAEFYGETNHYKNATDTAISSFYFGLAYEIGVTFSPIEKAEITAKWAHGKLNDNSYEGGWNGEYMISDPANNKCHNGTFTLGLKLIF